MQRISAIEGNYLTETAIRQLVTAVQNNLDTTNSNLNTTNSNLNTTNSNLQALRSRVQTIEQSYKTAAEITELLNANAQHHLPKGSIIDWYGTCRAANIPYGFVPCGMFGKDLTTDAQRNNEKAAWEAKYPNSINIVRTGTDGAYLQINACLGQTVPVLTDRFIVQAGHDYLLGASGGVNSVTLTKEQCALPSHTHPYKADYKGNLSDAESATGAIVRRKEHSSNITNATSMNYAKQDTAAQSHENRPPYFALYKLIKVI
jgi:microcystin-dependent protein